MTSDSLCSSLQLKLWENILHSDFHFHFQLIFFFITIKIIILNGVLNNIVGSPLVRKFLFKFFEMLVFREIDAV